MKTAFLLIIMLSNEGHWLSGTEGRVTLSWAAKAAATPCDLIWELKLGEARLGEGRTAIGLNESPVIKITCPDVRARVVLAWNWRLVRKEDGQEIAKGSEKLIAYPANQTAGWAELLKHKRIVLVDSGTGISTLLDQAKVPYVRLDDLTKLQRVATDIVIVGPDMFSGGVFEQEPLADLLQGGAAVVVFRQTRGDRLLGFDIVPRALAEKFVWPVEDPLFKEFDAEDLQSWERSWGRNELKNLLAVRVPSTAGVVTWPAKPREGTLSASRQPPTATVDCLLSSGGGKEGIGRSVFCQMPLGDWKTDPRSQIFLGNVLDVLISPPCPLAAPALPPATVRPRSTITLSPGDSP